MEEMLLMKKGNVRHENSKSVFKNMQDMEWGEARKVGRMCLHLDWKH